MEFEMEIEEEHFQSLEINKSDGIRIVTINNNEDKLYAPALRQENNRKTEEESFLEMSDNFFCNLPQLEESQSNICHQYVCSMCNIPMPNAKLLDVHVQEVHDSFFKILAERKPMYECYVSDCDLKFNSPTERSQHCISEHNYSKNCRFGGRKSIPAVGLDEIKLKANISLSYNSTNTGKRKNIEEECLENFKRKHFDSNLNNCCSSKTKSPLMFIPRQITQNKSPSPKILENECMMDI